MLQVDAIAINERGEVLAVWGDEPCRLRPSLVALDNIQTDTGLGIMEILDAQARMVLRVGHIAAIVRHTSIEKRTAAEVAERIETDGLIYWGRVVSEMLARAVYGAYALPKELTADPLNASTESSPNG